MGPQKGKKRAQISLKNKFFVISLICIIAFLPLTELAYKAGLTNKSPATELKSIIGVGSRDYDEYIDFLSVGQADCTVIKSGNEVAVIDFGLSDESDGLYWDLKKRGITAVDLAIVSHHHKDHMGGLYDLMGTLNIKNIILSRYENSHFKASDDEDTELYENIVFKAAKSGIDIINPAVGDSYEIGNAFLEVLYINNTSNEENNRSVIIRASLQGKKVLFMGDAQEEEEKEILKYCEDVSCDIIKIGHHGSSTSTSSEFLKQTGANTAVISCGYNNTYGHPSDKTVNRLEDFSVNYYRTDLDGNIKINFVENTFEIFVERKKLLC